MREATRETPIILFGIGGVGRALVRQILDNRQLHAQHYGLWLQVLAVSDRNSAVLELDGGIDDATLADLVELKKAGGRLSDHALGGRHAGDLASLVQIAGRRDVIVVDCTATDATIPALLNARECSYKLVLANKKPLTAQQEVYDRLTRAGATGESSARHSARTRWETTVGAGLPVIVTQNRLVASGDEITCIAGTFSGTLGFVMTGLQAGRPFSEVVREAHARGYTEPDPRDDLGGVDVARKALILARGLGWRMELADVQIAGLYPAEMQTLSIADFLAALPALDGPLAERVQAAAAQGKVLRYAATVADGRCTVGPTEVEHASPLGRLTGTDNLVEFTSRWYTPNPLVVQGRGAGIEATAAGVLSDIIDVAYTA